MNVITEEVLTLVKRWETYVGEAYRDHGGELAIGYGHSTIGPPKVLEGMKMTEEEASALLKSDLEKVGAGVLRKLTVALNDHQFGACCSLAYNMGVGGFTRSDAFAMINNADGKNHFVKAAILISNLNVTAKDKFTGKRRVFDGLKARRITEAAFFLHGGWA